MDGIGAPGSASPAGPSWDLTRIVLGVAAIGGLVGASFWVLRPFLPAVIWATMVVVATWPALQAVQARLWGKRRLAVLVMTGLMLAVVVAPIVIAVVAVVENIDAIVAWSKSITTLSVPAPPDWVGRVPVVGERLTTEWLRIATTRPEDLALAVAPYLRNVARWTIGQAGGLALLVVQLLLTVVISAILYSQGETVAGAVLAFARRLAGDNGERVAILSAQAIRAVALGIVVTALVQAIIAGIGLAVAGVPHAAVLTAVMFLLGVAQIGTVPVLACGVVWLYWTDQTAWATVLVVWALITASLDNFLRPMLIRRGADLPLLLIFAGVVGGLLAFGIIGLFIGPVVLAVTYTLFQAWVEDDPTRKATAVASAGRRSVE